LNEQDKDLAHRLATLASLANEWNGAPVLALYRTLSTRELRTLRRAFSIDRQSGADVTFCDRRLALIAMVLSERTLA
jgi:hypothetical protein